MIRPSVWSTYFYELSMPDKIAAFTEKLLLVLRALRRGRSRDA